MNDTQVVAKLVRIWGSREAIIASLGVRSISNVSNWLRAGMPDHVKWKLLVAARREGLVLTPDDLGAPKLRARKPVEVHRLSA